MKLYHVSHSNKSFQHFTTFSLLGILVASCAHVCLQTQKSYVIFFCALCINNLFYIQDILPIYLVFVSHSPTNNLNIKYINYVSRITEIFIFKDFIEL